MAEEIDLLRQASKEQTLSSYKVDTKEMLFESFKSEHLFEQSVVDAMNSSLQQRKEGVEVPEIAYLGSNYINDRELLNASKKSIRDAAAKRIREAKNEELGAGKLAAAKLLINNYLDSKEKTGNYKEPADERYVTIWNRISGLLNQVYKNPNLDEQTRFDLFRKTNELEGYYRILNNRAHRAKELAGLKNDINERFPNHEELIEELLKVDATAVDVDWATKEQESLLDFNKIADKIRNDLGTQWTDVSESDISVLGVDKFDDVYNEQLKELTSEQEQLAEDKGVDLNKEIGVHSRNILQKTYDRYARFYDSVDELAKVKATVTVYNRVVDSIMRNPDVFPDLKKNEKGELLLPELNEIRNSPLYSSVINKELQREYNTTNLREHDPANGNIDLDVDSDLAFAALYKIENYFINKLGEKGFLNTEALSGYYTLNEQVRAIEYDIAKEKLDRDIVKQRMARANEWYKGPAGKVNIDRNRIEIIARTRAYHQLIRQQRPATLRELEERQEEVYSEKPTAINHGWLDKYKKTTLEALELVNNERKKKKLPPASLKEAEKAVQDYFKAIFDANSFAMRVPSNVDKLLCEQWMEAGDIKLKNCLEITQGKSPSYITGRERFADVKFGRKYAIDPSLCEKYGYLESETGFAQNSSIAVNFGDVSYRMDKEKLQHRTTFTFGDSYRFQRVTQPSMCDRPELMSVPGLYRRLVIEQALDFMDAQKETKTGFTQGSTEYMNEMSAKAKERIDKANYIELQYHGDVSLEDVKEVIYYVGYAKNPRDNEDGKAPIVHKDVNALLEHKKMEIAMWRSKGVKISVALKSDGNIHDLGEYLKDKA